jgi:hypothetical protein
MESIALISTALALAKPFLVKTGEKFAEGVGEDIWKWIKKPFSKSKEKTVLSNLQTEEGIESLKIALLGKVESDISYKIKLEEAVKKAQKDLSNYYQQNINNKGKIGKQMNIQDNKGNIQM